jgi:hypothetical protein
LTAPADAIDRTCAEIGTKFQEFISIHRRQTTVTSIHVIGPNPLLWLAVAAAGTLGFFAFRRQPDSLYRRRLNQSRLYTCSHYALLLLVPLVVCYFTFASVWRSEDTDTWASFGAPAWAVAAGVFGYLCWVVAPLVAFTGRDRETGLRAEIIGPAVTCIVGPAAVLMLGWTWPDGSHPGLRFWLTVLLTFLSVVGGYAVVTRRWSLPRGLGESRGFPEWWQHPWWSGLMKAFLICALVVLVRGSFPCTPGAGQGCFDRLSACLSYNGLVVAVAAAWSAVGAAVAFTQQYRRFWLVPACVAASFIISLVCGV